MAEVSNKRIRRANTILAIILITLCTVASGRTIYVDADATNISDGSSWANAYWCLQDALSNAQAGDEIQVAYGTYKPDCRVTITRSRRQITASGDRAAAFHLINGVAIRGGYAGFGEPDPDARDVHLYETILSGDLNGNDGPNFINNSDNSYHVMIGSRTNPTDVLDGFTITGGNANRPPRDIHGGGIYADDVGNLTVVNCILIGNLAIEDGGGIYCIKSAPTIENSTIAGNVAYHYGGGIHCDASLQISNSVIAGNSAMYGGAIFCFGSSPTVTNCTIVDNFASGYGGGGIYCGNASPIVVNTILWNNRPDEIYLKHSSVNVAYSDVQGGWSGPGNINADPLFADADGADGVFGTKDDDLRLLPASPCIDVGDNSAIQQLIVTDLDGNSRVVNNTVDMGAYEADVAPTPNIHHVDADAPGNNDGSSWSNAFLCLQEALAVAQYGDEIRVANGTYRPDQQVMMRRDQQQIVSSGDWEATFQLIDGVVIKGGYVGFGEPDPNARDIERYCSVLSGDLNADDGPGFTNIGDNSYHVVTASGTQWMAVLDGFTIMGGNADGPFPYNHGGGICNVEGSPKLIDCTIIGNSTIERGGGMYNTLYSNPALINCTFSGNLADLAGGGMYNDKSDPMMTDCTFKENIGGGGGGGGMYNDGGIPMLADCDFIGNSTTGSGGGMYNNSSNPILLSCLLNTNSALRSGGGMYNRYTSQPSLMNCIFSGNSASNGGGMENLNTSRPMLLNCTLSANVATQTGGGISNIQNGRSILINCILWENQNQSGIGATSQISGSAEVSYSCVQDSTSISSWPGEGNINTDPYFADPENGDYHLKSQAGRWNLTNQGWIIDQVSSPCIDAGDLSIPVGLERFPNGGRINMGAYGSTPEASLSPSGLHAKYGGGTGELSEPYLIYSVEQMDEISVNEEDWDKHFKLMSNIDLSGFYYETALIARNTDTIQNDFRGTPFTGTFDGNGHTISHLKIEGGGFLGLFGRLESGAEVRNLGVVDVNVICSGDHAGGLVADNNDCLVTNCYSTGIVTGGWRVGGLVGYSRGEVRNCYSTCTVRGHGDVGGLVGSIHWGSVAYSYSIGSVSADSYVGGFLGETVGDVIACFWDVETSGLSNMCGNVGRDSVGCDDNNGKTTTEMQTASTFLEAGWDFIDETENGTEDIWWILEGQTYPHLWWEVMYEPPPEPEPEPEGVVIELTEATFDEIVLLSDLPVLVDFWAPWCGPCLRMAPVIEEIAEEFAGRLRVCKLNTDYSPSINERYDITAIPTIILFKDGQIQKIWIGVTSKEDIIAEFDFIESETDETLPMSVKASNPYPADGAENVEIDVTLSWTSGLNAVSHDVYFGTNRDDVVDADTSDTTGTYRGRNPNAYYTPPDSLIFSGTYCWRIDEVNEVNPNSPWKGNVWSFTTANFIVVDNFESYDAGDNQIWYSWHDGLGFGVPVAGQPFYPGNGTGSVVGFEFEWPEETVVHSGRQAMPYSYDNDKQGYFKYSEATLTLSYPRDWTEEGVGVLSLWFYGDLANAPEPMYVAVANVESPTAVVYHDNPNVAQIMAWTEWTIDLQDFADQGVNLTDVNTISIGFGDRNNPQLGGSGRMYFDDIRLYRP